MIKPIIRTLRTSEKGFGLVESLIAVMVLSIATTTFILGLSTASLALGKMDSNVTGGIIARSQFEHTLNEPYVIAPFTYPSISEVQSGYSVTSVAESIPNRDDNIQKISVIVSHNGGQTVTIVGFKLNQ